MRHRQSVIPVILCLMLGTSNGVLWSMEEAEAKGADDAAAVFQVGAAASNVTPPLGLAIVGGWSPSPATHIHDELYAKCIVLDDGETRIALVIVDNIGMGREVCDAAKAMIDKRLGIPPERVLTAGTHTHSSVSARNKNSMGPAGQLGDYQSFVAMRIADGVQRAVNNLEPARIGWGSAQVPTEVFNRRYHMKPGTPTPNPFGGEDKVVMNPGRGNANLQKAAGPTDPEVSFLSFQTLEGKPIALLANYSLHYVGPRAGLVYSADYFGVFGNRIQHLIGADGLDPPFVGIMSNGTSADINNINWLQKPTRKWGPYEKMNQVGDVVAEAVYKAHEKIRFHDWVKLGAVTEEVTLAVRKPNEEQVAYAKAILEKDADAKPYHRHEKVYAERVLQLHESPDEVHTIVQAFRIGDTSICTFPFEVFVEIGLQLKKQSPFARHFTISHANGTYGYLPTVEQHTLGGYETWMGTNRVQLDAAPKLVDRLLAMLESLK